MSELVGLRLREGVMVLIPYHGSPVGREQADFAVRLDDHPNDTEIGHALLERVAESTPISKEEANARRSDPTILRRYFALFGVRSWRSLEIGMCMAYALISEGEATFTPYRKDAKSGRFTERVEEAFVVTDMTPAHLGAQVRLALAPAPDPGSAT